MKRAAIYVRVPVSTDFDSSQCLKFNVRIELKMDGLRPALISALAGLRRNVIAGLCATPQQSI
jgi:hypothetical protein